MKIIDKVIKRNEEELKTYHYCACENPSKYLEYKKSKYVVDTVGFYIYLSLITICFYAFMIICLLNGYIEL